MKKKLLISLFIASVYLLPIFVKAQVNYSFAASSGAYTANGGTSIIAANNDDVWSSSTTIGFTFTYNCNTYTTFQANSSGFMTLGTNYSTSNPEAVTAWSTNSLSSPPVTTVPIIAPLWGGDKSGNVGMGIDATGNVNYSLTGTAPNRVLTVEWFKMDWNWNATAPSVSFQVKLYETTNKIQFVYNLINASKYSSPNIASIGLADQTSPNYLSLNNSGTTPTASSTVMTSTIATSPASGQIYSWTPTSCPTITTGAVNPTTFSLSSCAATATATVAFTSTGTYSAGNYYTAWLSDASGSFGTATNIGTLTSTANSGTINVTIPAGTAAGTGYLIQIASYLPAITGSNSSSFTITQACAPGTPISGVMSNYSTISAANPGAYGCDNACTETSYTVGPFAHPAVCNNDNVTSCSSCGSETQSITFTITAGCTYTAQAEQKARGASCPDAAMDIGDEIHISGTGGTLVSQYATLNSPGACSSKGIVAGVTTYTTADINDGCGNADGYVQLVYTAPAGAIGQITISYTSDRADEILTYTFTANSSTCGIIVLPIELMGFYASQTPDGIKLNWSTATETNNNYFMVEYSLDAINFTPFTEVKGAGNSYVRKDYTCMFTENIGAKQPYFRLKQVDYNGNYQYSSVITLGSFIGSLSSSKYSNIAAYYNGENEQIVTKFHLDYPQQVNISLYDVTGAKIQETSPLLYNEGDNEVLLNSPDKAGVYFLVYQNGSNLPVHQKIMIIK